MSPRRLCPDMWVIPSYCDLGSKATTIDFQRPQGDGDDFATPMQDPTQSPSFAQEILEQLQGAELRKLNLMDLGLNRRRMNSGMDQKKIKAKAV